MGNMMRSMKSRLQKIVKKDPITLRIFKGKG